jgi:hypothetical protein
MPPGFSLMVHAPAVHVPPAATQLGSHVGAPPPDDEDEALPPELPRIGVPPLLEELPPLDDPPPLDEPPLLDEPPVA